MSSYRGWIEYGGVELANSTRTFDILDRGRRLPPSEVLLHPYLFIESPPGSGFFVPEDPLLDTESPGGSGLFVDNFTATEGPNGLFALSSNPYEGSDCVACNGGVEVNYRDDWTGQADWLGAGTYEYLDPTTAPWYDPEALESKEFHGVLVMAIDGLDTTPLQRDMIESICDGGVASYHRDTTRTVQFEALLIGCSHAGVKYGLNWLACQLRAGRGTTGLPLRFLSASPAGSNATAATLMRTLENAVLTAPPTVSDYGHGYGGLTNRHEAIYRVQWEMASGTPYLWSNPITTVPAFGTSPFEAIQWVTGCVPGSTGCTTPVTTLTDPLCPSPALPVAVTPPQIGCTTGDDGSCVPLCGGSRYFTEFTPAIVGTCNEHVTTVTVTNTNLVDAVRGVTLWWVLCGGDPDCDALNTTVISYIPPDTTLVLDGVTGRVTAIQGSTTLTAPGLVSNGSLGPWSPVTLELNTCYELYISTDAIDDLELEIVETGHDA